MEKHKVIIEYPHYEPGEKVVLNDALHDGYTLIKGNVYTVKQTIAPTQYDPPKVQLCETPVLLSTFAIAAAPKPITDAERVKTALEALDCWVMEVRRREGKS